ncbi:MAG: HesB/IscA family protein [Rhodothermales bacterium]|jgi:iron-sulfur cluster assembly protein
MTTTVVADTVEERTVESTGPVSLTARAAEEIRKIMSTKNIPEGYHLRVGAKGGGCSGMSYILGFDRKRDHDIAFEVDGIKVFMDKRHGLYLMGTTVDYKDGLDARGFTFDNPNATATCGCGSSFSA